MCFKYLPILSIILLSCTAGFQNFTSEENEIRFVLYQQQSDWNKGDIQQFMYGYWRSDSLTFVGSNGLTTGWQNTFENYKRRYPNKDAMGQLMFEIIRIEMLSAQSAILIGKYTLKRQNDEPNGLFTLIWKKINNKWVIIADQTC